MRYLVERGGFIRDLAPHGVFYSAYITRNGDDPFLVRDKRPPSEIISLSEWLALVASDSTLQLTDRGWVFWSEESDEDLPFVFKAVYGHVSLDNPSPKGIDKMLELAHRLRAHVRGGDGEFYSTGTDCYFPVDESSPPPKRRSASGFSKFFDAFGPGLMLLGGFAGVVATRFLVPTPWFVWDMIGIVIGVLIGFFVIVICEVALDRWESR